VSITNLEIVERETHMKAFCLKCRKDIEIKYAQEVETRNGRHATEGVCSCCGRRVFKIGNAKLVPSH